MTERLYNSSHDAIAFCIQEGSELISRKLKDVLENKHLYQRDKVEIEGLLVRVKGELANNARLQQNFDDWVLTFPHLRFYASTRMLTEPGKQPGARDPLPTLILVNVKLFCIKCGTREVFSPIHNQDPLLEIHRQASAHYTYTAEKIAEKFQWFFVTYQCQHCKHEMISVLVRRQGWHLSVHGRSPMERIELPVYIPKKEEHLYRDTLVAMHSGKVLASLFYLRTFIEQFARRLTSTSGKYTGEEIMERYSSKLPPALRDSIPSFREWYGKLSEALHEAREDDILLADALEAIQHHFDIRRVHKIPE
jgi:hypothetical protein